MCVIKKMIALLATPGSGLVQAATRGTSTPEETRLRTPPDNAGRQTHPSHGIHLGSVKRTELYKVKGKKLRPHVGMKNKLFQIWFVTCISL